VTAIHEVAQLTPQPTPALGKRSLSASHIDRPLLRAILARWEDCFVTGNQPIEDRRLFRALDWPVYPRLTCTMRASSWSPNLALSTMASRMARRSTGMAHPPDGSPRPLRRGMTTTAGDRHGSSLQSFDLPLRPDITA
jgi:hypothetical protein